MTSWRDHASARAQGDLDGLLDPAFGLAQQQLTEHGEFFPYAVVIHADGETELVQPAADPANDQPASAAVITACRSALTARRDQLRATAVVADIHLPEAGDAIRVELEHAEGTALTVLLPYTRKRFGKKVDYGSLRAEAGTRHIWPA